MTDMTAEQDILHLSKKAFDEPGDDSETSVAAFKAVANTLLLQEESRQTFADSEYAARTADRLRVVGVDRQEELIFSRILFLLTYNTQCDFDALFEKHALAESIAHNITYHSDRLSKDDLKRQEMPSIKVDSIGERALSETLKLLFNLNQFYPQYSGSFHRTLPPILNILHCLTLDSEPLLQPMNYLINALLNIEFSSAQTREQDEGGSPSNLLFPKEDFSSHTTRLVQVLEVSIDSYSEDALESTAVPLITLLRRVNEIAPGQVQKKLREQLLPSDAERDQPLGKSNTLASKLLKLSTAPAATQVKEGISSLLFELSDKDPATFVRNVGYGYAAGYLTTHQTSTPSGMDDVGERVTNVDGREINPVTGQRRDMEPPDPSSNMSDEEKEREAERLFVLFERLRATGVMNVTNPVEQAVREGRLEEVQSDESEHEDEDTRKNS